MQIAMLVASQRERKLQFIRGKYFVIHNDYLDLYRRIPFLSVMWVKIPMILVVPAIPAYFTTCEIKQNWIHLNYVMLCYPLSESDGTTQLKWDKIYE